MQNLVWPPSSRRLRDAAFQGGKRVRIPKGVPVTRTRTDDSKAVAQLVSAPPVRRRSWFEFVRVASTARQTMPSARCSVVNQRPPKSGRSATRSGPGDQIGCRANGLR